MQSIFFLWLRFTICKEYHAKSLAYKKNKRPDFRVCHFTIAFVFGSVFQSRVSAEKQNESRFLCIKAFFFSGVLVLYWVPTYKHVISKPKKRRFFHLSLIWQKNCFYLLSIINWCSSCVCFFVPSCMKKKKTPLTLMNPEAESKSIFGDKKCHVDWSNIRVESGF
jgi:hypothetical protein